MPDDQSDEDRLTPEIDVPGASCQRRYEQLRSEDLRVRRERRGRSILIFIGLTLTAGLVVVGAAKGLNAFLESWLADQPGAVARTGPIMQDWLIAAVAGAAAFATAANLGRLMWGKKATTEAYRIGAEGERRAGRDLAALGERGWILLHDRKVRDRDENIDHLAVGPSGVVVVETKNWAGKVDVGQNSLRRNGRDEGKVLGQVERQVRSVRAALARLEPRIDVRAVIYFPRADVRRAGSRKSPARPRGIRVCEPRHLIPTIVDAPDVLTPAQVEVVAATLRRHLRPA